MLRIHVSVQWHDEIDDAHVYEMKCTFVGAKHLGCYNEGLWPGHSGKSSRTDSSPSKATGYWVSYWSSSSMALNSRSVIPSSDPICMKV